MKKGDISFSTLVTALIAVLVFVVLVIVFRKQLTELLKPVSDAIRNIGEINVK